MFIFMVHTMPTIHWQPIAHIEGLKGCGGCHKIGIKTEAEQKELRKTSGGFGVAPLYPIARAFKAAGNEVKLNYATQVETAPPTFAVFGNNPDQLQEHYVRYLHNCFREVWGFTGNPLRLTFKRKSGGGSRE